MDKRKTLITVGSALLLIGSIISIIVGVFFLVARDYLADTVYYFIYNLTGQSLKSSEVYFIAVYLLIGIFIQAIVGFIFGMLFLKRRKLSDQEFEEKKTSYIILLILEILLYGNLVITILLAVPLFIKPQYAQPVQVSNVESSEPVKEVEQPKSNMIEEIKKLKELKEKGIISDSEYNILLTKIIK